jgi:thioredoxin reductase (NADPH)
VQRIAPLTSEETEKLNVEWELLGVEQLDYASNEGRVAPRAREISERRRKIQHRLHLARIADRRTRPEQPADTRDAVVIGAGPAGLTAAIHTSFEGLDTLVLEGSSDPGGQSARSSHLENIAGFPGGIKGSDYALNGFRQAEESGAEIEFNARVSKLTALSGGEKLVELEDGREVKAHHVVIATGLHFGKLKTPGLEGENVVYGSSEEVKRQAAPGEPTVVIGGGNSAGQAALDLARNGRSVTMLVRSNLDKMSPTVKRKVRRAPGITILERVSVKRAERRADSASNRVAQLVLDNGKSVPAAAVGIYVGQGPTAPFADLEADDKGFIAVGGPTAAHSLETSIPGVYAGGDTRQGGTGRVQIAAGEGAAIAAEIASHMSTERAALLRKLAA